MSKQDEPVIVDTTPKSMSIAERGIYNSQDFLNLMAAVAADVLARRITPAMANSVTNTGGKMLKAAEAQIKYGTLQPDNRRVLPLAERGEGATPGSGG